MTRVGLIGNGNIAKKHIAALEQMDEAGIIAIHDIVKPRSTNITHYSDIDTFLDQDLDIVTVCSPNGKHAEHCIQALQNGKHVICEKPLALSPEQGCLLYTSPSPRDS